MATDVRCRCVESFDRLQSRHHHEGHLPSELKQCIALWRLAWSLATALPIRPRPRYLDEPPPICRLLHLITLTSGQAVPLRQNLGIGRGDLALSRAARITEAICGAGARKHYESDQGIDYLIVPTYGGTCQHHDEAARWAEETSFILAETIVTVTIPP